MRKILQILIVVIILLTSIQTATNKAHAANKTFGRCTVSLLDPNLLTTDTRFINKLKIDVNKNASSGTTYYIYMDSFIYPVKIDVPYTIKDNNILIETPFGPDGKASGTSGIFSSDNATFYVLDHPVDVTNVVNLTKDYEEQNLCENSESMKVPISETNSGGQDAEDRCVIDFVTEDKKPGTDIFIKVRFNPNNTDEGKNFRNNDSQKFDVGVSWPGAGSPREWSKENDGNGRPSPTAFELENGFNIGPYQGGTNRYLIKIGREVSGFPTFERKFCKFRDFTVDIDGGSSGCTKDSECTGKSELGDYCLPDSSGSLQCGKYPDNKITNPCQPNLKDKDGNPRAIPNTCNTAIGPIGIQPEKFARSILVLFLSLSGGILVIFFIINGYKLMTSQGDPKKIQEARESIISAIAGLLLIIFSLAILKLITVDILGLPGFS